MISVACAATLRLVANILLFAILANQLPIAVFEIIAAGLLVGQIAAIFVDSGTNTLILRHAGVEGIAENTKRVWSSIEIRLPIALLLTCAAVLLATPYHGAVNAQLFGFSVGSAVIAAISETIFVSLRATRQTRKELSLSASLVAAIIVVPWLATTFPAVAAAGIFVSRALILFLCLRFGLQRSSNRLPPFDAGRILEFYSSMRHYFADSALSNLAIKADSILALILLPVTGFALYQPAAKFLYSCLGLAGLVAGLIIPPCSRMPGTKALWSMVAGFISFGVLLALVLQIALVTVLPIVFGEEFSVSTSIAISLSTICLLRYASAGFGAYLTHSGKQKHRAIIAGVIVGLTIIGAIVLWLSTEVTILGILQVLMFSQFVGLIVFVDTAIKESAHAA